MSMKTNSDLYSKGPAHSTLSTCFEAYVGYAAVNLCNPAVLNCTCCSQAEEAKGGACSRSRGKFTAASWSVECVEAEI